MKLVKLFFFLAFLCHSIPSVAIEAQEIIDPNKVKLLEYDQNSKETKRNAYDHLLIEKKGIYLNYSDLIELSKASEPEGELKQKLTRQLNTPIIQQPQQQSKLLSGEKLGEFFRVGVWNLERGYNIQQFGQILGLTYPDDLNENVKKEINILAKSSVIILNEVDYGVPRTKYKNIVRELARKAMSGYIFVPEFVEVNPYQLGIKKYTQEEKVYLEPEAVEQLENIQKDKYIGLHGTAILTRFPVRSTMVVRLPVCYDWYKSEESKISAIEKAKRGASEKIFATKVLSELRHGGRIAVVVDLELPNKQIFTLVAVHLENRCLPDCREKQMHYLLNRIRHIRNPVIIGGDFNTTGSDASPTSLQKEVLKKVKDPEYVARQAIVYLSPIGFIENVLSLSINKLRQYKDPTTKNIPIILPNKERQLFDLVEGFKFDDGNTFDFRGNEERTRKERRASLANSNERDLKGFKTTFELNRSFGIGKFKLDWFFVKPLKLNDPKSKEASYAFAPHFGRTLDLANRAYGERLSDHDPITVDIPIYEPSL